MVSFADRGQIAYFGERFVGDEGQGAAGFQPDHVVTLGGGHGLFYQFDALVGQLFNHADGRFAIGPHKS